MNQEMYETLNNILLKNREYVCRRISFLFENFEKEAKEVFPEAPENYFEFSGKGSDFDKQEGHLFVGNKRIDYKINMNSVIIRTDDKHKEYIFQENIGYKLYENEKVLNPEILLQDLLNDIL